MNKKAKEMIEPFLIRAAIPEARTFPAGWEKSNLLWDAVFRAHRDVLTGRKNVAEYARIKDGQGINCVVITLYESILRKALAKETVSSIRLIEELQNTYKTVTIGILQKLVNMTLKYLLILQEYKMLGDTVIVSEKDCDCPLDSVILPKIPGTEGQKWTQIDSLSDYQAVQGAIDKIKQQNGLSSRLAFDFDNWQTLAPLPFSDELEIKQER